MNFSVVHTIYLYIHVAAHTRLADLHRTMNVHIKPPSVTRDEEGAWLGAWLSGRMVGKKETYSNWYYYELVARLLLCMAVGKLDISYPPSIPEHLPPTLRAFLAKYVP